MPLCGYNSTMARGLADFCSGLAVQTKKRADEESVSVPEVPAIELAELDLFLKSLSASAKKNELAGIIGLTMFVRHLYAEMQELTKNDASISVDAAFRQVVDRINRSMFEMEDHYYGELRPKLGIDKAIQKLTPFLEQRV